MIAIDALVKLNLTQPGVAQTRGKSPFVLTLFLEVFYKKCTVRNISETLGSEREP
jgi:hypothetical protein